MVYMVRCLPCNNLLDFGILAEGKGTSGEGGAKVDSHHDRVVLFRVAGETTSVGACRSSALVSGKSGGTHVSASVGVVSVRRRQWHLALIWASGIAT